MGQIFIAIKTLFEVLKLLKYFFAEGKALLNEVDEARAKQKKQDLAKALEALETAKTRDEKREAIKRIANNSFR